MEIILSDLSHTFPINGKFTDRQRDVYQAVLNTRLTTIAFIKPGVSMEYVYGLDEKISRRM